MHFIKHSTLILILTLACLSCANDKASNQKKKPASDKVKTESIAKQFVLTQLGEVPREYMQAVAQLIKKSYPQAQLIQNKKELPANAITTIKSKRYRADSLIRQFQPTNKQEYVVLITTQDISTTKQKLPLERYADWGVMGLGSLHGRSCIISTFRIKYAKKDVTINRLRKVVIHEIGHCFALPHCSTPHCVMSDANESISTIDQEGEEYCAACQKKLVLNN
jgi:archaemetzincin